MILIGNLGADPEIVDLESGTKVASMSIATNETYKDRQTGERKTATEWHRVKAFNQLAGLAQQYLSKGRQVYIEGRLKHRTFEDKEGQTRKISEVWVDNLTFLGGGDPQSGGASSTSNHYSGHDAPATSSQEHAEQTSADDDLPF